jgi:hypothetical protein
VAFRARRWRQYEAARWTNAASAYAYAAYAAYAGSAASAASAANDSLTAMLESICWARP